MPVGAAGVCSVGASGTGRSLPVAVESVVEVASVAGAVSVVVFASGAVVVSVGSGRSDVSSPWSAFKASSTVVGCSPSAPVVALSRMPDVPRSSSLRMVRPMASAKNRVARIAVVRVSRLA